MRIRQGFMRVPVGTAISRIRGVTIWARSLGPREVCDSPVWIRVGDERMADGEL